MKYLLLLEEKGIIWQLL